MLLLELTDGTQTVFGMEYQLIPALKVSTPPGTKVVDLIDLHFSRAGLLNILCFSLIIIIIVQVYKLSCSE